MLELMSSSLMDVYLMNTGRVGGTEKDERSKKVKIQQSSAIVKAIAEGTRRVASEMRASYATSQLLRIEWLGETCTIIAPRFCRQACQ